MKDKQKDPMDEPFYNLAVIGVGVYICFAADVLAGLLVAGVGLINYLRCMEKEKKDGRNKEELSK